MLKNLVSTPIKRGQFLLRFFTLILGMMLLSILAAFGWFYAKDLQPENMHAVIASFAYYGGLFFYFAQPIAYAPRIKDIGWSPWLSLASYIPYVGLAMLLFCALAPTRKKKTEAPDE